MTALTIPSTLVSSSEIALSNPGSLGNIEAYIQAVNHLPLLTAEQEIELANDYRDKGNLDAARKLVLSHLRLVVSISRHYLGYGLAHADLIQEGNIGLMKAVKRFDPSRGVRLVSFAIHWIKAEIHEHIVRNWRLVKVATTKAQRKLFFNLRSMKSGSHTLTGAETDHIAKTLNVKPEEVRAMETRLSGQDISLETKNDEGEDEFGPISYLIGEGQEPTQMLENKRLDALQDTGLQYALNQLDQRSQHIVKARWLNESEDKRATLEDLAHEFGISAERVRQIETQAMKKMKQALISIEL